MEANSYADLIFNAIGSVAIIIAILELLEIKKKRKVEMYWQIAALYTSDGLQKARRAVGTLEKTDNYKKYKDEADPSKRAQLRSECIKDYHDKYHDAPDDTVEEILKQEVQTQLRFLDQAGILLKKGLVDKDMLFSLIGAGFEIDYPILEIALAAHRAAHEFPRIYNNIDYLYPQYMNWKNDAQNERFPD